jgi:hypothetical protein
VLQRHVSEAGDDPAGDRPEAVLAGEGGEAGQRQGGVRVGGRGGVVEEVLLAGDEASASWPVVKKPPLASSQKSPSSASAVATAASVHRASPVSSARRVKASTRAAWSAA